MSKIDKITKLPDGTYKVEETGDAPKQTSIVNKVILKASIQSQKEEIAKKQAQLAYEENLLKEINKI